MDIPNSPEHRCCFITGSVEIHDEEHPVQCGRLSKWTVVTRGTSDPYDFTSCCDEHLIDALSTAADGDPYWEVHRYERWLTQTYSHEQLAEMGVDD